MKRSSAELQSLLIIPVAMSVLLVWVASAGYAFIEKEYAPLTITTPVMLILAGFVFGFRKMAESIAKGEDKNAD